MHHFENSSVHFTFVRMGKILEGMLTGAAEAEVLHGVDFIFHVEHDLIVNGQDIHHEIMDAQAQRDTLH